MRVDEEKLLCFGGKSGGGGMNCELAHQVSTASPRNIITFVCLSLLLSFHRCKESCRTCSKRSSEHFEGAPQALLFLSGACVSCGRCEKAVGRRSFDMTSMDTYILDELLPMCRSNSHAR